ncbi:uncharacterized protein At5g08430-like isoform X1 [Carica papaya]|uniref:uncharacterized protein At5g08430-like isoform X1 n=1 Tax=Carica papaya TaxID=3649 RepID=UPI000B8CCF6E|nr:uncharacterized protein At5g08430-like isoform X1 [Carica papaya]
MVSDVGLSLLSDDDISEEECEGLRQQVKNGLLEKPTVVEFEQKARSLHEDIMKHWIEMELVRLQKLVDFANIKGWRREVDEYLEQRELLKKPEEQERLLKKLPTIISEDLTQSDQDSKNKLEVNEGG